MYMSGSDGAGERFKVMFLRDWLSSSVRTKALSAAMLKIPSFDFVDIDNLIYPIPYRNASINYKLCSYANLTSLCLIKPTWTPTVSVLVLTKD